MTQKGLILLVALTVLAVADGAQAQFYKGKTITMIINYPAGGPTDIEGRIVAQHLPAHIAGKPNIIIKNVGGAGGVVGSNQLAEAAPNGDTMGFFTIDVIAQLLGNPALRVNYSDFAMIAGVEEPLVAYARKDTPPGLKVATDIMQAKEFKALSLNAQNSNTINQALSLDLLGLKYRPIPAYRGLKEVETAILQNEGQLANTSLPGWTGSVEPTMGELVIPLWQVAPRGKDGGYPRSAALPDMPTFEEFMSWVETRAPFGAVIEAKAAGVGAEIAQAIGRSSAREHLAICSFRPAEIQAAKEAQPDVPCILLFHLRPPSEDPVALIRSCHADGADVPWQWLDENLCTRMHQAGLLVGGGTADDEQSVNRLLALNADFVDSNYPRIAVGARDAGTVAR